MRYINFREPYSSCFCCLESAAVPRLFFSLFVIHENLQETKIQQNGIAEYVMLCNKIENQLPYCVNNMDKDEAEKK